MMAAMFRCWSPAYVEEENFLCYDDFDSLKEWLVHPDHVQLQNPSDLGITSLDSHELHYSDVKREQKDQILESSIDMKMEKVTLVEISDRGQEDVGLEENRGGRDEYMKWVKPPGLEELKVTDWKSDLPNKEGCLEEGSDGKGLEDLKSDLPNKEGSLEDVNDEGRLDDLKCDLPNTEGSLEEESNEEWSTSEEAEADSGDSSSDEISSDEKGLEDLKSDLPNKEGSLEDGSDGGGLDDLKCDLPNTEGSLEEESNEEGSTSEEAEADSGDSSSDEISSDESDESMSVSKSLSSNEDEDGGLKKREEGEEFEEGEVRGFDAHRVDFLSDEEGEGQKGPIRSKHEPEDLPPVPMVEVSLQPHHQMLPVGIISSIMSNRVIVEGSVLHNPLNEGSILWVTDTRFPLGLVDEIFGPVKNPYYVVRYNAEEEVPAGIGVGIAISFVREFASQILNEKELYKKGYDASGENDEEVDSEEEFSDDEEELMHKKSLREGKRVINHCEGVKQEAKFERRRKAYMGPRDQHKDIQKQSSCVQSSMHQPHPTVQMLPQPAQLGPGSWSSSSGATNADLIPPSTMPQFPPQAIQTVNYVGNLSQQLSCNPSQQLVGNPSRQLLTQHQNTQWFPGFSPQLQNTGLQGDLPIQLQNQNVILNNLVNMMAFQQLLQQFVPHQGSNFPWVGAAPSVQALGQNNFAPSPFNNGFINDHIQGQVPLPFAPAMQFNAGNSSSLHFNGGNSSSRGRRPYQRGGGRFFDGGGRQPNR